MVWLADGSAHHAELTPSASRSGWLLENLADAPTLVESFAGAACNSACDEERPGPQQQPGSENHTPARLCRQPEPSLADRKELRVAEADRAAASGETARTGKGGLAVRLQLRRAQPAAATKTDGPAAGKAAGSNAPEPWLRASGSSLRCPQTPMNTG